MTEPPAINPCQPSPCGPYAQCQVINESPSCSCLPQYTGSPPNCRPECVSNNECPSHQACINQKCKDPCPGTCGANAECYVVSHTPNCMCSNYYTGNPFVECVPAPCKETSSALLTKRCGVAIYQFQYNFISLSHVLVEPNTGDQHSPCSPTPCGSNAVCKELNGAGSCSCLPDYQGNPYEGCRPECVINSDCPSYQACIQSKCRDPCPGACGQNAECTAINHLPSCNCRPGYSGDPFRFCYIPLEDSKLLCSLLLIICLIPPLPALFYKSKLSSSAREPEPQNPCQPSPCGPNSQCKELNNQAVCSCLPTYIGSPPGCRPECISSSECPSQLACINQKCVNPCPDPCGLKTNCVVVNHSPICSCLPGHSGDPFTRCTPIPRELFFYYHISTCELFNNVQYRFFTHQTIYLQLLNH